MVMEKKVGYALTSIFCVACGAITMVVYYMRREPKDVRTQGPPKTETGSSWVYGTCPNQVINVIGDGYCDDEANIEECWYDMDDCCIYGEPDTFLLCTECFCFVNITQMVQELDCNQMIADWFRNWKFKSFIGNGICDDNLNSVDYFFDAGDCCIDENDPKCLKSNLYCDENTMGDGTCQDYNNGPKCDYDLGDCCLPIHNQDCCFCKYDTSSKGTPLCQKETF